MDKRLHFEPPYPDVLGAIAGHTRITLDPVQAAVGIFPKRAYINQPIEVVAIVQNMIDQGAEVRITLDLPTRDPNGKPVAFSIPKKSVTLHMTPGETGVVRMPLAPIMPSQPAEEVEIKVSLKAKAAKNGQLVRPPTRGAPPSVLAVSPFKLQVLRDIQFPEHVLDDGKLSVSFSIDSKRLPNVTQALKPTYEPLWTRQQLNQERQHLLEKIDAARVIAQTFVPRDVYISLFHAVDELYAAHGLPLHPGESRAIAKMLVYTFEDQSDTDPNYRIEDQRWFQTLCQTLAVDETVARKDPGEVAVEYLFDALIYDAILFGFTIIRSRVRVNLGDRTERIHYAERFLKWLAGQGDSDLVYIYLPLVLGGLSVNHLVRAPKDDPWVMLDELREAMRGRIRLASRDTAEIFDMLEKLLERSEEDLRRARIMRE
ncbi:MAG: hypothetical protein J0M07_27410 [Anaerolineae bacterium]|nr:hypothetical protein [Anaerolineae bacterium]